MARGTRPLLVFDRQEDWTAWTDGSGTVVVTAGQGDPLGGTAAYQLTGDSATERRDSPTFVLAPNFDGQAIAEWFVRKGTSTSTDLQVYDNTAAAVRVEVRVTWSGNVPQLAIQSGSGTLFPVVKLTADDWYLVRFAASGIVNGNAHRHRIEPGTGTIFVYGASAILFDLHLDRAHHWSENREGSVTVEARSGVEDAWLTGTNYFVEGEFRWIPSTDTGAPYNRTGWDGVREHRMINVGVDSALRWGRDKQLLTWCPDRANTKVNQTVYLWGPLDGGPGVENDDTKRVTLTLKSSAGVAFTGY